MYEKFEKYDKELKEKYEKVNVERDKLMKKYNVQWVEKYDVDGEFIKEMEKITD